MMITVGQYLESIANADGRFRTLRRVYPVKDGRGEPLFSMQGHGLADFEIMSGDRRYTLRCVLGSEPGKRDKLRALCGRDRGLGSRFFTEWTFFEDELILFDTEGVPFEVDILARPTPRGEPLADFIGRIALPAEAGIAMAALNSFGELSDWAYDKGCGGIGARKLLVSPDGTVSVTGFSATDETPFIALALLFTAILPDRRAETGVSFAGGLSASRSMAERLCAAASGAGFAEPAQILAGDVAGGIRKFFQRAESERAALGRVIAAEINCTNQSPDSSVYEWCEDGSGEMKRVRDGGGWRYVDRFNRPVIENVWLSAGPFREGRAEVETKTGKGLIDREGRAVVDPVHEELVWDPQWGLVTAMAEGRWSLFDRDGRLLTRDSYEWIGECCEGLILMQKDGKCGFIDTHGRVLIAAVYDDATSFSEGCSFVTSEGSGFFIDPKGRKITQKK